METSQRYIVRELTGYRISLPLRTRKSDDRPSTDVYVLDRWDCYNVVASYLAYTGCRSLVNRRLEAQAVQRKLEQDHRRWLAEERRGRVV